MKSERRLTSVYINDIRRSIRVLCLKLQKMSKIRVDQFFLHQFSHPDWISHNNDDDHLCVLTVKMSRTYPCSDCSNQSLLGERFSTRMRVCYTIIRQQQKRKLIRIKRIHQERK